MKKSILGGIRLYGSGFLLFCTLCVPSYVLSDMDTKDVTVEINGDNVLVTQDVLSDYDRQKQVRDEEFQVCTDYKENAGSLSYFEGLKTQGYIFFRCENSKSFLDDAKDKGYKIGLTDKQKLRMTFADGELLRMEQRTTLLDYVGYVMTEKLEALTDDQMKTLINGISLRRLFYMVNLDWGIDKGHLDKQLDKIKSNFDGVKKGTEEYKEAIKSMEITTTLMGKYIQNRGLNRPKKDMVEGESFDSPYYKKLHHTVVSTADKTKLSKFDENRFTLIKIITSHIESKYNAMAKCMANPDACNISPSGLDEKGWLAWLYSYLNNLVVDVSNLFTRDNNFYEGNVDNELIVGEGGVLTADDIKQLSPGSDNVMIGQDEAKENDDSELKRATKSGAKNELNKKFNSILLQIVGSMNQLENEISARNKVVIENANELSKVQGDKESIDNNNNDLTKPLQLDTIDMTSVKKAQVNIKGAAESMSNKLNAYTKTKKELEKVVDVEVTEDNVNDAQQLLLDMNGAKDLGKDDVGTYQAGINFINSALTTQRASVENAVKKETTDLAERTKKQDEENKKEEINRSFKLVMSNIVKRMEQLSKEITLIKNDMIKNGDDLLKAAGNKKVIEEKNNKLTNPLKLAAIDMTSAKVTQGNGKDAVELIRNKLNAYTTKKAGLDKVVEGAVTESNVMDAKQLVENMKSEQYDDLAQKVADQKIAINSINDAVTKQHDSITAAVTQQKQKMDLEESRKKQAQDENVKQEEINRSFKNIMTSVVSGLEQLNNKITKITTDMIKNGDDLLKAAGNKKVIEEKNNKLTNPLKLAAIDMTSAKVTQGNGKDAVELIRNKLNAYTTKKAGLDKVVEGAVTESNVMDAKQLVENMKSEQYDDLAQKVADQKIAINSINDAVTKQHDSIAAAVTQQKQKMDLEESRKKQAQDENVKQEEINRSFKNIMTSVVSSLEQLNNKITKITTEMIKNGDDLLKAAGNKKVIEENNNKLTNPLKLAAIDMTSAKVTQENCKDAVELIRNKLNAYTTKKAGLDKVVEGAVTESNVTDAKQLVEDMKSEQCDDLAQKVADQKTAINSINDAVTKQHDSITAAVTQQKQKTDEVQDSNYEEDAGDADADADDADDSVENHSDKKSNPSDNLMDTDAGSKADKSYNEPEEFSVEKQTKYDELYKEYERIFKRSENSLGDSDNTHRCDGIIASTNCYFASRKNVILSIGDAINIRHNIIEGKTRSDSLLSVVTDAKQEIDNKIMDMKREGLDNEGVDPLKSLLDINKVYGELKANINTLYSRSVSAESVMIKYVQKLLLVKGEELITSIDSEIDMIHREGEEISEMYNKAKSTIDRLKQNVEELNTRILSLADNAFGGMMSNVNTGISNVDAKLQIIINQRDYIATKVEGIDINQYSNIKSLSKDKEEDIIKRNEQLMGFSDKLKEFMSQIPKSSGKFKESYGQINELGEKFTVLSNEVSAREKRDMLVEERSKIGESLNLHDENIKSLGKKDIESIVSRFSQNITVLEATDFVSEFKETFNKEIKYASSYDEELRLKRKEYEDLGVIFSSMNKTQDDMHKCDSWCLLSSNLELSKEKVEQLHVEIGKNKEQFEKIVLSSQGTIDSINVGLGDINSVISEFEKVNGNINKYIKDIGIEKTNFGDYKKSQKDILDSLIGLSIPEDSESIESTRDSLVTKLKEMIASADALENGKNKLFETISSNTRQKLKMFSDELTSIKTSLDNKRSEYESLKSNANDKVELAKNMLGTASRDVKFAKFNEIKRNVVNSLSGLTVKIEKITTDLVVNKDNILKIKTDKENNKADNEKLEMPLTLTNLDTVDLENKQQSIGNEFNNIKKNQGLYKEEKINMDKITSATVIENDVRAAETLISNIRELNTKMLKLEEVLLGHVTSINTRVTAVTTQSGLVQGEFKKEKEAKEAKEVKEANEVQARQVQEAQEKADKEVSELQTRAQTRAQVRDKASRVKSYLKPVLRDIVNNLESFDKMKSTIYQNIDNSATVLLRAQSDKKVIDDNNKKLDSAVTLDFIDLEKVESNHQRLKDNINNVDSEVERYRKVQIELNDIIKGEVRVIDLDTAKILLSNLKEINSKSNDLFKEVITHKKEMDKLSSAVTQQGDLVGKANTDQIQAKLVQDKADKEKADKEKADKEKADKEKADKEKADKEKADKEKADKEKADKEKLIRRKLIRRKLIRRKLIRRKLIRRLRLIRFRIMILRKEMFLIYLRELLKVVGCKVRFRKKRKLRRPMRFRLGGFRRLRRKRIRRSVSFRLGLRLGLRLGIRLVGLRAI
ncbi:MAG: hypothetical protein QS748_03275 [Candidatus Endonucleobacter bathymodioli]|uniref:Uncharacterized protein n=1 Tax=Candidatus Endonucleibacter bathymodioli TaxID=539814 RepID=A0AA90NU22_9GAMM|nr:hypothetical protein [Candidatus Endonucleobacter bathymodioli]